LHIYSVRYLLSEVQHNSQENKCHVQNIVTPTT